MLCDLAPRRRLRRRRFGVHGLRRDGLWMACPISPDPRHGPCSMRTGHRAARGAPSAQGPRRYPWKRVAPLLPIMYKLGMTKMSTAIARKHFSDVVNRAHYGKQRIALTRHGENLAAVVPFEDLQLLDKLEDQRDLKDARKALAEAKAKGDKPVPWAKAKKRLGL